MDTNNKEYSKNLRMTYLPGRRLYLFKIVYPKYIKEFTEEEIFDFGCGIGEFLNYCTKVGRKAKGIDSSPYFVESCQEHGLHVQQDDITRQMTVRSKVKNAICDNVLEHLEKKDIHKFFINLKSMMLPGGILLAIVPGKRGFLRDITHKTFIDRKFIENLCCEYGMELSKFYYFPVNNEVIGRYFYLNMSVFKLTF